MAEETDERFPSGPWIGFWLQQHVAGRQWMQDLWLKFVDGKVEGAGSDWVGDFVLHGNYELESGTVTLFKQYLQRHLVTYKGHNDNDGKWVWGVWTMDDGGRGGFHLWPKGVEDPTIERLEAEADAPLERVVVRSS